MIFGWYFLDLKTNSIQTTSGQKGLEFSGHSHSSNSKPDTAPNSDVAVPANQNNPVGPDSTLANPRESIESQNNNQAIGR